MIDEREILNYNMEMAEHANGAAQFMGSLIGGQYVTNEKDSAPPNGKNNHKPCEKEKNL